MSVDNEDRCTGLIGQPLSLRIDAVSFRVRSVSRRLSSFGSRRGSISICTPLWHVNKVRLLASWPTDEERT